MNPVRRRWGALGVVLGLLGCVDRPAGSDEGSVGTTLAAASSTTSEGSASGTSVGSTSGSTVGVDSTAGSSSSSDDASGDDSGWPCGAPGSAERLAHCPPDGGGVSFECDVLAQDCAVGEKCMPWANDGGPAWNATRCSPIADPPDPVGSPCTVEGSALSGLDSCELGAQCWDVDPLTDEGECVAMCTGDVSELFCEDPDTSCLLGNDGAIALCLPNCDPLLQDCQDGEVCVSGSVDEAFVCIPGMDEPSADGGPCEYLNVCATGLVCAIAEAVPGCDDALGCCTPLCDLSAPEDTCAMSVPGTTCSPWYMRGQSPGVQYEALCSAVSVSEIPEGAWSPFDVRANVP
jgi:hypothetical protein